jgi:two-component system cell cycle sensor histidine kinase/response regulator CckA
MPVGFAVLTVTLLAAAITAHHRAQREAALRASVERFDLATRATFNVIWDYDLVAGVIWRNDNYVSLFGYPTDARADLDAWATLLHPDDRDRVWTAIETALHSEVTSWSDTFRYRRKDGSYAVIEDRCEILRDTEGRAIRLIGAMHDVTEREEAQQLLRLQAAALDAAANGIVITDRAGTIVWTNPGFTQLTGYAAEDAIGRSPRELLKSGVHDQEFYRCLWDQVLAGEIWRGEMTNRRKDGTLYPERMTITPMKAPDGTITHFIAIKEDLTAQKRLEQQFLQSQKMEVVGHLAGGIAHDFNNLLTVINMSADLLSSELASDNPLRHDAAQIMAAGGRAAALTRQLLAFSRKQVLKPALVDLGDLARGMENMLQRLIGVEIQLTVMSPADLGRVKADPGQIEQVLMNLAVNARDAMPEGGRLTVVASNVVLDDARAVPDLPSGAYVVLSVTDSGTGMDAETRAHLFEPFFSTKGTGCGTGLGLSTVYGIVKQSGGSITVDSTLGEGSTFRIYLPRIAGNPVLERVAS